MGGGGGEVKESNSHTEGTEILVKNLNSTPKETNLGVARALFDTKRCYPKKKKTYKQELEF